MSCEYERACGHPKEGAVYFLFKHGPGGRPIEDFLVDSPIEVPNGLTLAARGVTMIEKDGVWHIVDRIGLDNYPNVYDFIEEVRAKGLSRRLPQTLDFSKLTQESRLLCVHDRALVGNARDLPLWNCPRHKDRHNPQDHALCLGACISDIVGGVPTGVTLTRPVMVEGQGSTVVLAAPRTVQQVRRTLPGGTSYVGYAPPAEVTVRTRPAFFAAFPCTTLCVYSRTGSDNPAVSEAMHKALRAQLPVEEVEL